MEFKHTSVLLDETIENLNIRPDGVYMDGTLGGAGHSKEIAKRLGPDGHLIGIDQDGEAIITARRTTCWSAAAASAEFPLHWRRQGWENG